MTPSPDTSIADPSQLQNRALATSIILYLIACASPALILHVGQYLGVAGFRWSHYQSISGIQLLVSGLFFGILRLNFTAFANLPLWVSWILFARRRYPGARFTAWLAFALSLETIQLIVQPYLWDEAATREGYLFAPHIGFLCWIASMLVIAIASQHLLPAQRPSPAPAQPETPLN